MITKVVVSAAGRGTRMKHMTKNKPKHMINVQGRPFLFYVIENLRLAGLKEIIVVTGHHAEYIEEFAKTHPYSLTVVNQFAVLGEEEYGTACPIKVVKDIIGTENFLAVAGDNLYQVEDIQKVLHDDDLTYVGCVKVEHPENKGVLVVDGDSYLEKIVEKPKEFMGNLVNTSLYKFTPEIFQAIEKITLSPRGEYEITDAVTSLARERKVKVVQLGDYWMDFGKPSDIPKLSRFIKQRK